MNCAELLRNWICITDLEESEDFYAGHQGLSASAEHAITPFMLIQIKTESIFVHEVVGTISIEQSNTTKPHMQKTTKTVYITSDKQEFASEAEAQAHEIDALMNGDGKWGKWIVEHKDEILSIIGARRKPRSDKGKKRVKSSLQEVA